MSEGESSKGSARRVLVVDDNQDTRDLVQTMLEIEGHVFFGAETGADAITTMTSEAIDIALVDIGLGDVDGYEVARTAREKLGDRTPLLVAITGYGRPSDIERAKDAGFDHHLVKPVDVTLLADVIRNGRG